MSTRMQPVHKTKAELAVEAIREAILRGELRPGERITLAQLSDWLGMSVTPIREAIRILEAEGLVSNEPHRGVNVNDLSLSDVDELYMLRAMMESLATKLAVPHLGEAEIGTLEALHATMQDAVARRDDALLTRANADWHFHLYAASRTRYLVKSIVRLWMPFHWSGLWRANRREASLREHEAVMDAIRAGDADRAARLMHEHITEVHLSIMGYLQADAAKAAARGAPLGEAVFALHETTGDPG